MVTPAPPSDSGSSPAPLVCDPAGDAAARPSGLSPTAATDTGAPDDEAQRWWPGPAAYRVGAIVALVAVTVGGATLASLRGADPVTMPASATASPTAPGAQNRTAGATADSATPGAIPGATPGTTAGATPAATSGVTTGAGSPVSPPLYDSGRIGHWQRMGNEHAGEALEARAGASPRGITLLGDSSLTRARPDLMRALRGRPVAWDQWNGRPTHGAVDVAAALDGAKRLPATIVLMSGSNDIFFPDSFAPQIEKLMSIAGPKRRVVWVAPYVKRPRFAAPDEHNTRRLRDDLLAAAGRHPNLTVVDWAQHVLDLPEADQRRLMPDGAHPSPAGCRQLTRLITAQLP